MRPRTCVLYALTLSVAMSFGIAANAADLPKEGTYTGTWSGFGTFKGTPVGKELVLVAFDQNALTVGNGLIDHLTWYCFGLSDVTNGLTQHHGYCVATDPAGDHIGSSFASDGKYAADAKSYNGTITFAAGTGKYAGISGDVKYVCHAPEFRPLAEGTYLQHCTTQGSYKLP